MGTATLVMIIGFVMFTFTALARAVQGWIQLWGREMLTDLDDDAKKVQELASTKARLLQDIKELEFDHEIGHLSDDDYGTLRKKLERKTIRVMRSMDRLAGGSNYDAIIDAGLGERYGLVFEDAGGSVSDDAEEPEALEAPPVDAEAASVEVQEEREAPNGVEKSVPAPISLAVKPCHGCGWEMEVDAAFCSQCGVGLKTSSACLGCGSEMEDDARFCKDCGAARGAVKAAVDSGEMVAVREASPVPVEER